MSDFYQPPSFYQRNRNAAVTSSSLAISEYADIVAVQGALDQLGHVLKNWLLGGTSAKHPVKGKWEAFVRILGKKVKFTKS